MLYDIAVDRQQREQDIVEETKRLFVRYISHEIRTPLNTVHLGIQVHILLFGAI
jgi:signal transduction histidine kinase